MQNRDDLLPSWHGGTNRADHPQEWQGEMKSHGPQPPTTATRTVEPVAQASLTAASRSPQKKPRKRAHYLRHSQRCAIINRIIAGEQQAALAREFKVTRAAISHIFKNREEILARVVEDESEEEEEDDPTETATVSAVTEISDNAVVLLLTTLRDAQTNAVSFNRAATRLITFLLEESLALLGTRAVERTGVGGEQFTGLEREQEFCGIALNDEALPFAVRFSQMENESPVGTIKAEEMFDDFGNSIHSRITHMDLPASIVDYKVLLFTFVCGDNGGESKAVAALRSIGVEEKDIAMVAILSSARSLDMMTNQFPQMRVVTAIIEDQVTASPYAVFAGLPAFVAQYLNDKPAASVGVASAQGA